MLVQHAALFGARRLMTTAIPACAVTHVRPIQAALQWPMRKSAPINSCPLAGVVRGPVQPVVIAADGARRRSVAG
jgi:hypothetical protein